MGIPRLLSAGFERLRQHGLKHTLLAGARRTCAFGIDHTSCFQGESIFAYDWDMLIILDACRSDAVEEVASEFEFLLNRPPHTYSVASCSSKWMDRTFTDGYCDEIRETAYISANTFTDQFAPVDEFFFLDEVWKSEFNTELGTIPPRPVTDRAISTYREHEPNRLLVHYMQPHFPSIPHPLGFGIRNAAPDPDEQEWVWDQGKPDGYSRQELWKAYIDNLRYVLEEVTTLLDNIDAEMAVLTADHGNAFGELGMWGHPGNNPFPTLRKVPWIETSATDTGTHTPRVERVDPDSMPVEEKLRALGYRE